MEKQEYSLMMSLNHFMIYIAYSKIISYSHHPVVKDILKKKDILKTWGMQITKIEEYDLKIQLIKLIKGKVLD